MINEKAAQLGRIIAERGHTVVTGGCTGLPYVVASSASKCGAASIAFSPARDLEEHKTRFDFPTDAFSELRFIPKDFDFVDSKGACLKLRNVYTVAFSDAIVFISGKTGTLNEFTIAYDLGKPIGALKGSGRVTDSIPQIIEMLQKPSDSIIVYSDDPEEIIERLEVAAGRHR